ncbi:MAG: hypothetical protein WKF43_16905 [Acidimicrobiales bacterium]
MPDINTDDLTRTFRDALYVGVGLGVIAFQKAQVQRVDFTKQVKSQLADARQQIEKVNGSSDDLVAEARRQIEKISEGFEDRVKMVEERLETIESQFDGILDQIEEKLPETARDLVKQARDTAKEARSHVHSLVRGNSVAA